MRRTGYWRVDGALLWGAMALFDPPARPLEPAELPLAPMSVDDAIRLVRVYERRAREGPGRSVGRGRAGVPDAG